MTFLKYVVLFGISPILRCQKTCASQVNTCSASGSSGMRPQSCSCRTPTRGAPVQNDRPTMGMWRTGGKEILYIHFYVFTMCSFEANSFFWVAFWDVRWEIWSEMIRGTWVTLVVDSCWRKLPSAAWSCLQMALVRRPYVSWPVGLGLVSFAHTSCSRWILISQSEKFRFFRTPWHQSIAEQRGMCGFSFQEIHLDTSEWTMCTQ